MTKSDPGDPEWEQTLTSRAYEFTVEGRDAFFALSIEQEGSETAWLISDTVVSLDAMR